MIPYTKMRLFACWNNLHTIVSARGDYSPFQIVYALRRQSPLSNCVRTRTQFRLFLMESLCQRSISAPQRGALWAAELRYILLKKTEKHTICSMRKTIFNKKCSTCNTLFEQKCCVYKTFFVILQRISLFNQQSEQL